jgi:hypothetical protein
MKAMELSSLITNSDSKEAFGVRAVARVCRWAWPVRPDQAQTHFVSTAVLMMVNERMEAGWMAGEEQESRVPAASQGTNG